MYVPKLGRFIKSDVGLSISLIIEYTVPKTSKCFEFWIKVHTYIAEILVYLLKLHIKK